MFTKTSGCVSDNQRVSECIDLKGFNSRNTCAPAGSKGSLIKSELGRGWWVSEALL